MTITTKLDQILAEANSPLLDAETGQQFTAYLDLLQRWNAKTNLTAIRDEDSILRRHFAESILCARLLPSDINSLLDFGSGAGFPGIPIALIRKEIAVTLAESQNKKAAFLREAVRVLGIPTKVHADRAEQLSETFDCVTLRAVDKMDQAIPAALALAKPTGWLAILTTNEAASSLHPTYSQIDWQPHQPLPKGSDRILALGRRRDL
jgi:16S rRNA (guanine527-N7)-methyltransferase